MLMWKIGINSTNIISEFAKTNNKTISYVTNSLIPNFTGLTKDTVQIDKVKVLKEQLKNVLSSKYCQLPDIESLIPKNTSRVEKEKILKELFEESKFFSRVSTCEALYGKNFEFAKIMSNLRDKASTSITDGKSFTEVLKQIANGYSKETTINTSMKKRIGKSGIYRGSFTRPPKVIEDWGRVDTYITGYGVYGVKDGYSAYVSRLNNVRKRVSPYNNFKLTEIQKCNSILKHPYHEEVAQNMKTIKERYNVYRSLVEAYKKQGNLTSEQKQQADGIISEIYYLMANTCPFYRGSNGISDVLMRSQYSALGINKPHVKNGVGLDLEAFCMNLDEYKTKWNSFFEK